MVKAVKAFIVKDDKILIIKRSMNDNFLPGIWELPGGRIKSNERIIFGLKREVREEVGIEIEVKELLNTQRFLKKSEGIIIEMSIFVAIPLNNKIILSDEHSDYLWIELNRAKDKIVDFFHGEIDLYNKRMAE